MWIDLKKRLWRWRGVFVVVPATTGILLGIRFMGLLQPLELAAYDLFFQLRPSEMQDERIVLVAIDEPDIQKYNSPISDATLAKLLNIIKQQQPRSIGLDIYRDLPVEPGYKELAAVFESTPNLIGIRKFVGNKYGHGVAASPILEQRRQIGANDSLADGDGKIRRALISLRDNSDRGKTVLSFSTALALQYLKAENINAKVLDPKTQKIQLGKAIFTPLEANDGGYVRADVGGYQILSNYRNFQQGFKSISLTDVLENRIAKDLFRDRLVLIGITAESSSDRFVTPFNNAILDSSFILTSGVKIQANIASQLISSAIDGRPLLKVWTKPIEYLWIAFWTLISSYICWTRRYATKKNRVNHTFRLPWAFLAIVGLEIGIIVGSYMAFSFGWWVPMVPTLLAIFSSAIAITSYTARNANAIRQIFGRYLTDEVVANLLETPEGLNLGGERRKVTLLFSDLRGFSSLFEEVEPEQGVKAISLYLDIMTSIITKYKGTINEFIGDGIFVMFGAPIQREDDTQRAVTCAIAMQLAMAEVNTTLDAMHLPALKMGIGLHTGEVLAGNIGSQQRAKYTVMGSAVNLASRIESYTVGGQVLVSEAILDEVKSSVRIDAQMRVKPKGFKDAIVMFDIGGINDLALAEDKETLVELGNPILIKWNVLKGKHVVAKKHTGKLIKLSANNAEVKLDSSLELLTNLQISFPEIDASMRLENVDAKVVEVGFEDTSHCWIRFTAVPSNIAEWLYDLRQTASSAIDYTDETGD